MHKVVENRSGRTLVLKKVSKKGLIEEGAVRQFQREVEIHCRIHHPNITKMYAYFHDASNCYLLLELADLGTLYSKVASGRLGEREAACIFRQLACAVAHMHRRGVIHRDIKPENVFLNCGQAGDRDEVSMGERWGREKGPPFVPLTIGFSHTHARAACARHYLAYTFSHPHTIYALSPHTDPSQVGGPGMVHCQAGHL